MVELAPEAQEPLGQDMIERKLALIEDDFELIPEGPLFSAIWKDDIDVNDLVKRRYPTSTETKAVKDAARKAERDGTAYEVPAHKPVITNGLGLVAEVLVQKGILRTSDQITPLTQQRDSLMQTRDHEFSGPEQRLFEQLDRLVRIHEKAKRALSGAYDTYYGEAYWEDPLHRSGLKTDELEALYLMTEPYEDQGLLRALNQVEKSGAFTADITFEASRIARILVAREINAIA